MVIADNLDWGKSAGNQVFVFPSGFPVDLLNQLAEVQWDSCPWSKLLATDTTNQKPTWAPSAPLWVKLCEYNCSWKICRDNMFRLLKTTNPINKSTTSLINVYLFHPHGIFWNRQNDQISSTREEVILVFLVSHRSNESQPGLWSHQQMKGDPDARKYCLDR